MLPLEEVCFTDSNIMMKSDMKRLSGGSEEQRGPEEAAHRALCFLFDGL